MKLIELRKDGHTAFVKKGQVVWMLTQGWDLAPALKLGTRYIAVQKVKAKRC